MAMMSDYNHANRPTITLQEGEDKEAALRRYLRSHPGTDPRSVVFIVPHPTLGKGYLELNES